MRLGSVLFFEPLDPLHPDAGNLFLSCRSLADIFTRSRSLTCLQGEDICRQLVLQGVESLVSDEVDNIIQKEGFGAVPAGDQIGGLLHGPAGTWHQVRACLGGDAGGVWRLLRRTLTVPDIDIGKWKIYEIFYISYPTAQSLN